MRALVLWSAVLLFAAPAGRAIPDDAAAPPATGGATQLRQRVRRWMEARQLHVISTCRACGGSGVRHRIDRDARGNVLGTHDETCKPCDGRGSLLDWARARESHWDVKSPSFRGVAGHESAFQAMVRRWLDHPEDEPVLRQYRIGDVTPTGTRFGIVTVFENGESTPRETRWIWVAADGPKLGAWYLFDDTTDGAFDATPTSPAPPSPSAPPAPLAPIAPRPSSSRALDDEQSARVVKALAGRSVRAVLHSGERTASGLLLRLRYVGLGDESALRQAIAADVIPATQALMSEDLAGRGVTLEFLTCYRDRLGEVRLRPYETAAMDAATFAKIHFENLTTEEALALFRRERASYQFEDVILWWKGACGQDGPSAAPPPLDAPTSPGPLPTPSAAVAEALRWLAAHQSPDGGWEAEGFGRWNDGKPMTGEPPDGAGKAPYDVGVTGLALLTFLRAGYGARGTESFAPTVQRGLAYLRTKQDAEGCFGTRSTGHYVYNHAIAALAMLDGYDRIGGDVLRRAAQKALDFSALARNPYFAWRYGVRPGDNDTSVTGWFVQGFFRAKEINDAEAGQGRPPPFAFAPDVFEGARAWIDKMTDPDTGRVGYQQRGTGPARPQELVDRFPAEKSEAMTAIALLIRAKLGQTAAASPAMRRGVALCIALPPVWNEATGVIDMYHWHHATEALRQIGGAEWGDWRSKMLETATGHQRKGSTYGAYRGSWDPVDPWGDDGGRVYSTAMMTLCLEACGG